MKLLIKEFGYLVKLDTNGSIPERLISLIEQGLLDYVAMDIKNSLANYGKTIGIEGYDTANIRKSVEYLMQGNVPFEFRTTVVRNYHKKEDFIAIGKWIQGKQNYYLQAFKDSGDLIQPGLSGYSREIMEQAVELAKKGVPNTRLRGMD